MDQAQQSRWWPRGASGGPAGRVTTVEVFFDVVFVLTLTQLSRVLEADLSLAAAGRVLLLFGILWWMLGVVISAAGIHGAVAHPGQEMSWPRPSRWPAVSWWTRAGPS